LSGVQLAARASITTLAIYASRCGEFRRTARPLLDRALALARRCRVFPEKADCVITRILMDLSPDGTPAFLQTTEFWDALELATKIVGIFDNRRFRRERITRNLLREARPGVLAEFYRILGKMPSIVEKLAKTTDQPAPRDPVPAPRCGVPLVGGGFCNEPASPGCCYCDLHADYGGAS
jgi:hypothetical protein